MALIIIPHATPPKAAQTAVDGPSFFFIFLHIVVIN